MTSKFPGPAFAASTEEEGSEQETKKLYKSSNSHANVRSQNAIVNKVKKEENERMTAFAFKQVIVSEI